MHLKVGILETQKTLKTLSSGQIYKKKTYKTQKKTQKNAHWAGFLKKNPGFFQPWLEVSCRKRTAAELTDAWMEALLSCCPRLTCLDLRVEVGGGHPKITAAAIEKAARQRPLFRVLTG